MVGRNDPCPCGSGKKYKRCHQRMDEAGHATTDSDFVRYFGYDDTRSENASPFDLSTAGLVCMVFPIQEDDLIELEAASDIRFQLGDWAVSSGVHENSVLHGPFSDVGAAFE